jgi:hypothetical protein
MTKAKNPKSSGRGLAVSGLAFSADVERELEWFFTVAQGEMGDCSNYERSLSTGCSSIRDVNLREFRC